MKQFVGSGAEALPINVSYSWRLRVNLPHVDVGQHQVLLLRGILTIEQFVVFFHLIDSLIFDTLENHLEFAEVRIGLLQIMGLMTKVDETKADISA